MSSFGLAKEYRLMVVLLVCGLFIESLTQTLVSPALPAIMREFDTDASTAQWLASGYSIVTASTIPLSAYIIGRFSTRRIFIFCLWLFVIGSALCAFAPNFVVLLLGRLFQAACIGGAMPMVMTVVLLCFPAEKRGGAIGLIGLVIGAAPAAGPALAGFLVDSIGWRWIFIIVGAFAALILVLSILNLKSMEGFDRTKFDIISVILTFAGMIPLIYGLSIISTSDDLWIPGACIVIGIAFLALYARRQLKLSEPMLNVRILKNARYASVIICIMLIYTSFVGSGVIFPLMVQNGQQMSAAAGGTAMLPGAFIGAILGLVGGSLFDKHGPKVTIIPGALVMLSGAIFLSFLQIDSSFWMDMAAYTLFAVALQFTMTPLNTYGYNSLMNEQIHHAQPITTTSIHVSSALGPAVLVAISASSTAIWPEEAITNQAYLGCHIAFIAGAILIGIAFLITLTFLKRDEA